jgi:hypothetical protein
MDDGTFGRAADALGVPPWLAPFASDVRDVHVEAGGQADRGRDVPRRPWDRLGDTPGLSPLAPASMAGA